MGRMGHLELAGSSSRNWQVQFSGGGREALRRALLGKGARLAGLVPPERVERLLEEFHASAPASGRGYTVSVLLTFAAWLEANT